MKTSDLIGPALDWAVAKCEGGTQKPTRCFDCRYYEERQGNDDAIQYCHHLKMDFEDGSGAFRTWPSSYETHERCPISELTPEHYSTDWAQGGPIIERERITVAPTDGKSFVGQPPWCAYRIETLFEDDKDHEYQHGPTPLIAAMRCYVASKLGEEIEIPEEVPDDH